MADTSLIFRILARDDTSSVLNKIKGAAQSTADAIERSFKKGDTGHLNNEIDKSKSRLRELAQEFDRTGDHNILKDMSKERSNLNRLQGALEQVGQSGFGSFIGGVQSAGQSVMKFGSNLSDVWSALWGFVSVLGAAGAAAAFAVPAITLLGGAIGSLPAIAVGGIGAIGTLMIGMYGLSDAFKKTAGASKSAADNGRQLAQAEKQIRDAQQQVLDAQLAVNRAREEATRRIRDESMSLAEAQVAQQQAAIDLRAAEADLVKARLNNYQGDDLAQVELAYERQKLAVEDANNKVNDLTASVQKNNQTGVEGSDEVTEAKKRQAQAEEQLADAQANLADVQRKQAEAAASAAAETIKLAPAAQAVVDKLKALKPAFDDLRLDVQQRLFSGLSDTIQHVATAWLPTLKQRLGEYADTYNGLAKTFAQNITTPSFISNVSTALDTVRANIDKIGQAVAGPFTTAMGNLAGAASPFINALGDEVAKLVTDFSNWINKASQSGDLQKFFDKAAGFLHDVFSMGRDVGAIIGDIASAIFGADKSGDKSPWDSFKDTLHDIRAWFDNKDNQKKVQEWFQKLETDARVLLEVAGWVGDVITWLINFEHWIENAPAKISRAVSGMWDGMVADFKGALNQIIYAWNRLHFTIGGGSFLGISWPSFTLNTPDIPYLARGGDVQSGGLAVVGENGPELVSLSRGAQVTPLTGSGGAAGGTIRVELVAASGDEAAKAMLAALRPVVRGQFGGNVQLALGGAA